MSEWEAFRCSNCGYVHENGPANYVNVHVGDHCIKCGTQFSIDDKHTRESGELFEWESA